MPEQPIESINDRIALLAGRVPDDIALSRLVSGGDPSETVSYGELDERVRGLAWTLMERGQQGKPVLIPERNGCAYVIAYLACLRAGSIAVTAYRPRSNDRSGRLDRIIEDARPGVAIAEGETIEHFLELDNRSMTREQFIRTDGEHPVAPGHDAFEDVPGSATAMYQYTSGSTSRPRAVSISHGNLQSNLAVMSSLFYRPDTSSTVCWLPLFHDMGLIGLVMTSLMNGITAHIMAPEEFVMRPLRWLQAISSTRAAHSGGPNFAFELCVERTTPEEREGLDLSCWKSAMNGAEPIRPESIDRFIEAFQPHGFDPAAFQPCYGLAESTLVVATRRPDGPLNMPRISRSALQAHRLEPADGEDARRIVSCGPPVPGHDVRILDPAQEVFLGEGLVGEICVRGGSVAGGYQNSDDEEHPVFVEVLDGEQGPWLRTGDLGGMLGGELIVAGRRKDLILVGGMHPPPTALALTSRAAPRSPG